MSEGPHLRTGNLWLECEPTRQRSTLPGEVGLGLRSGEDCEAQGGGWGRPGDSQCGFSDPLWDLRWGDLTGGGEECVLQVGRLEGLEGLEGLLASSRAQNCQTESGENSLE